MSSDAAAITRSSCVKMPACSPYSLSFTDRIAFAMSEYLSMETTGANTS
jgi:hypothetical protein